jgi:SAM-dependent methyltransferase
MTEFEDRLNTVYGAGGDQEKLNAAYGDWAASYDADLWASGNPYIAIACTLVGRFVPDLDARILDGGCGTGTVGQILSFAGYRNIEGLDPSEGMLAVARAKGGYRALHQLRLEAEIGLEQGAYDAVVASGVLTQGHARPDALDGMLNVAKPGAPLIFSMSKIASEEDGFGEKIAALERAGRWEKLAETSQFQTYPFKPEVGHYRHWISAYAKR